MLRVAVGCAPTPSRKGPEDGLVVNVDGPDVLPLGPVKKRWSDEAGRNVVEYAQYPIPPGPHTIRVSITDCRPLDLGVDVDPVKGADVTGAPESSRFVLFQGPSGDAGVFPRRARILERDRKGQERRTRSLSIERARRHRRGTRSGPGRPMVWRLPERRVRQRIVQACDFQYSLRTAGSGACDLGPRIPSRWPAFPIQPGGARLGRAGRPPGGRYRPGAHGETEPACRGLPGGRRPAAVRLGSLPAGIYRDVERQQREWPLVGLQLGGFYEPNARCRRERATARRIARAPQVTDPGDRVRGPVKKAAAISPSAQAWPDEPKDGCRARVGRPVRDDPPASSAGVTRYQRCFSGSLPRKVRST